jgi:hypothetical protein
MKPDIALPVRRNYSTAKRKQSLSEREYRVGLAGKAPPGTGRLLCDGHDLSARMGRKSTGILPDAELRFFGLNKPCEMLK